MANAETTAKNITLAKALRKSFNQTQRDLCKETFWDDAKLAEMVRDMQQEYKLFHELTEMLKAADNEAYEKHILGTKD